MFVEQFTEPAEEGPRSSKWSWRPDARLASPQAGICPLHTTLGYVMRSLRRRYASSKISSCNWLCGEVRFICCLQRSLTQYEECSVSHPRPIIPTIPSAHPANNFAEARSESNSRLELVSSPPSNESSVYSCSPGNADVAARCCQDRMTQPATRTEPVQTAPGGGPLKASC